VIDGNIGVNDPGQCISIESGVWMDDVLEEDAQDGEGEDETESDGDDECLLRVFFHFFL